MLNISFEETQVYKELKRDAYAEAKAEAIAEVKAEAEEETRMSMVSLVVKLLRKRFEKLPENTSTAITQLSSASLEKLGSTLLDFSSISDLQDWLEQEAD